MWLEFETDGVIDENVGMSMGNEGESSQVVGMIMYKKAKNSSKCGIKGLAHAKFVS
jgi:hypothetical protein